MEINRNVIKTRPWPPHSGSVLAKHRLGPPLALRALDEIKSVPCFKGTTPAGFLKPLSQPAAPPPPPSWSPLRLFAQAVALQTAPLSVDVLFPGESWRLRVCFPSPLKGHIHLRARGEREAGVRRHAGRARRRYFESKRLCGTRRQARGCLAFIYLPFLWRMLAFLANYTAVCVMKAKWTGTRIRSL